MTPFWEKIELLVVFNLVLSMKDTRGYLRKWRKTWQVFKLLNEVRGETDLYSVITTSKYMWKYKISCEHHSLLPVSVLYVLHGIKKIEWIAVSFAYCISEKKIAGMKEIIIDTTRTLDERNACEKFRFVVSFLQQLLKGCSHSAVRAKPFCFCCTNCCSVTSL